MVNIVEALGIDAADAAPDFRRHIHIRLLAGETPRPHTGARHHDERKRWFDRIFIDGS